jgi:TnpA family transposase
LYRKPRAVASRGRLRIRIAKYAKTGLNKGEARNALARAVFFNRLGEIRDRSFEQ